MSAGTAPRTAAAVVALCVILTNACAVNHQPAENEGGGDYATSGDPQKLFASARGIVTVVGNEPQTAVLLAPADGAPPVALVGEQTAVLHRVAGVEIEVRGARVGGQTPPSVMPDTPLLEVQEFTVVAVDGVPAHDGIIEQNGGGYHLRLQSGARVAVPALPPLLREQVGARVYLVGPLDRAPASYGVIRAR